MKKKTIISKAKKTLLENSGFYLDTSIMMYKNTRIKKTFAMNYIAYVTLKELEKNINTENRYPEHMCFYFMRWCGIDKLLES